ncbi:hypothetical protein IWW40_004092 [Coemansia sp. RSA 1250]|nr:hypothetical protein IWW40_004092 [Coemansia sp. RSA 1250]
MQYNYPNDGGYYQDTLDDPYQFNYNDQMFAGDLVGNFSTMATPGLTPVEQFQPIEPPTTRKKARKPRETRVKSAPRPKTPWSLEQNQRFFRTLAEYIYVDKSGLKPLAIYLNQQELEHVDHCENILGMSDIEIAQSLSEQEAESNPNRCGHLLFEVLRHMQRASGVLDVRAVNEKAKNVRSRIINRFIGMYDSGVLPPKRPARYVAAILGSLTASPLCPVSEASASMGLGVYSTTENKHDVCLWLQAMMWLYPRKMYDFLLQCSVQIARAWAEDIPVEYRSPEDFRVLNDQEPDIYTLVELLRRMVNDLSDESGTKKYKSSRSSYYMHSENGSDVAGKKRKRKLTLQETKRATKDENATVITNDEEQISVGLFDLLKTKEKLKIAGMRNKMLAAVGGVVRNGDAKTMLDIKYHLYRLWTCVARFAEVSKMLVPSSRIPAESTLEWPRFAEFVVVHDYSSPFDVTSIEPRLRVSKDRMVCKDVQHNIEDLIKQWVASTEGETRIEIPIWLVIARRSDNQMVLGLVISSLDTEVGSAGVHSLISSYRKFDDASLMPVIDTAIVSGGSKDYNNLPMHDQMGLDPWPWSEAQESVIAASDDFRKPVNIQVGDSNVQLVVSSAYAESPEVIDPWLEPRVMPSFVFNLQKTYAGEDSIKLAPEYTQLLNEEDSYNSSEALIKVKPSSTSASNNASSYNNIWKQMPTMPINSNLGDFSGSLGTLAPQALTAGIPDISSVASVAAFNAANMDYNINGYSEMPPMLDSSSNLMMASQQNFPVNILNGYAQNEWGTVFDPNNPYPQMFSGSGAPSEYGPP